MAVDLGFEYGLARFIDFRDDTQFDDACVFILDRFLHHAEVIAITGRSYRLRNQKSTISNGADDQNQPNLPTGSTGRKKQKPTAEKPVAETAADCET